MADHFWWNTTSSGSANDSSAASTSVSLSSAGSGGALNWMGTGMVEKARSGDDQPAASASGSSVSYQEARQEHPTFDLSASTMNWNQALFGRAEPSFHALLQDDMISRPFFHQDPPIDSGQMTMLDQHHLSSNNDLCDRRLNSFQLAPATSYGCSTAMLRAQFESDNKPQQSTYHDNRSVLNNYQSPTMDYSEQIQPSWPNFTQLASSSEQQQSTNQFQFLNNTQLYTQFAPHSIEQKPSGSNLTQKSNIAESSSSLAKKRSNSGGNSVPVFKKPRMETPSPLPSFKVRKEKLGDRITALQQLVSPFGKTDTASVLHEAIEYIKFLHDQVNVLSNPYLKNGHPQHQKSSGKSKDLEEPDPDLRSRGLCLVPVASTYSVASQTPSDFWTPTFGGTFR